MTTYCSKWSLVQFLACWEFYIKDLVSALGTGGSLLAFEDPNLVMLQVGSRQQQVGLERREDRPSVSSSIIFLNPVGLRADVHRCVCAEFSPSQ